MWAVLGDIEFEVKNQPSSLRERITADYAQHALIQGKPRSEWVADGLDELSLELTLHAFMVDPEEQIRRLKEALRAHKPLPFVLGSGEYRGVYLITELGISSMRTDEKGQVVMATVSVNLLEYAGIYERPKPEPQASEKKPETQLGKVGSMVKSVFSSAQEALTKVRQANNFLRVGMAAYQMARDPGRTPSSVLGQTAKLLGLTVDALQPLAAFKEGGELQESLKWLESGRDLLTVAGEAASEVETAVDDLKSINQENVLDKVDSAAEHFGKALELLSDPSKFAGLAAEIITRSEKDDATVPEPSDP